MNLLKSSFLVIMIFTAFSGGVVWAADEIPASVEPFMRDRKGAEFFKELGLSDEQKKALGENRQKNRQAMRELRQTMESKMTQMREELQKTEFDMAKINQLQGELKEVQAKLMDQRLEGIIQVRKILTPEQFKRFSQKIEERRKQWQKNAAEHGGKGHRKERLLSKDE